ncbi:hypothetical protein G7Y89_g15476 [Cudoniella acicularis]|uniref:Uncharacterized protein n=1 Tax=Cudoniella acicularis TaxID=354080 RepID=A0A8H4QM48_9HELO|nr:hypothetical protein G7Y89_g15476 [Cudoniella acicularis]
MTPAVRFFALAVAFSVPLHALSRGIKWLDEGRSVLIRLDIPGLPLWNQEEHIGEDKPSALILNFTVTPDRHTLLLQDQAILPLSDPNAPPRINAPQTPETIAEFENRKSTDYDNLPFFALDYERIVHPRDDPSIQYYNYVPSLTLNLLGAGIEGYNTLLKQSDQLVIKITLKDYNAYNGGKTTNPPIHLFEVTHVRLWERWPNNPWIGPDELSECTSWSWRCEEFGDTPWYRYIYRKDFDRYGKIGSLRHAFLQRWGTLNERLGFWRVVLLLSVAVTMTVSPIVYCVYKAGNAIKRVYNFRTRVSKWELDDEEVEGLLVGDDFEVKYEKDHVREGEDSSTLEKPLPPVPTGQATSTSS